MVSITSSQCGPLAGSLTLTTARPITNNQMTSTVSSASVYLLVPQGFLGGQSDLVTQDSIFLEVPTLGWPYLHPSILLNWGGGCTSLSVVSCQNCGSLGSVPPHALPSVFCSCLLFLAGGGENLVKTPSPSKTSNLLCPLHHSRHYPPFPLSSHTFGVRPKLMNN